MKAYRENGLVRIHKKAAEKMYNDGKDIMIIPCNMNPANNSWFYNPWVNNHMKKDENISFNALCDANAYYNCNKETGLYLAFYIKTNQQ